MIITTIYNIGDEVYILADNKIKKGKIVKPWFDTTIKEGQVLEDLVGWELDIPEYIKGLGFPTNIHRLEKELFKSKDDLIEHLKKEDV